MNLDERSYELELLDGDNIPFEDIRRNMQELNFINTWLGGHGISIAGLSKVVGDNKNVSVCEIGCGGGDNLVALHKWCLRRGINATFTGIDIKPSCIAFAKTRHILERRTAWIENDYRNVEFENKPDVIFSSLFCHHFTNDQLVAQLQWMKEHSAKGFFINDLERNKIAYLLIKALTKIFSSSYLVKNDAPLSVARGFKSNEWKELLKLAGINEYSIDWKWAFRYLVYHLNE